MQLVWYLFIDGAYLRRRYTEQMRDYFGQEGELDFRRLFSSAGAFKAFYYDCLEDRPRDGEPAAEFQGRLDRQRQLFEEIQALPGYHVRLGALSGALGKIRQKKVDVLLAVDMLTHGFKKNLTAACLLAGDLDFQPVVHSLIELGSYVRVMYDRHSVSADLYRAADEGFEITLREWHAWSTERFRQAHPIPHSLSNANKPGRGNYSLLREGVLNGRSVGLYERAGDFLIFVDPHLDQHSLQVSFRDRAQLERFFRNVYGDIEWST